LAELSLEQMQTVHADISEDVYNVLSVEASVASRMSYGGTAPAQVLVQIQRWRDQL
jgi:argininosuccinate lyase